MNQKEAPITHDKQAGLFDYLEKNKKNTVSLYKVNLEVTICPLPLSLMRTMQSESLIKEVISKRSKEEQETPVNKRQLTAKISSEQTFIEETPGGKKRNVRLAKKLDKMAAYNFEYILNREKSKVEKEMSSFTLEALKVRLQQDLSSRTVATPLVSALQKAESEIEKETAKVRATARESSALPANAILHQQKKGENISSSKSPVATNPATSSIQEKSVTPPPKPRKK